MRSSNALRVEMPVARFFVCLALLLWSSAGLAEELRKNVALVIGNSAYQAPHGAASAINDGRIMADALKALGFEVFAFSDLNQRKMHRALLEFRETLRERGGSTVAFVFFAGTALELQGQNYLIPVDAQIENARDVDFEAVSLATVLNVLKSVETHASVLVIDACYRNSFAFNRGASNGLAEVDAPNGDLIAFSAAPGTVALDGSASGNSHFTAALAQAIAVKGVKIEDVFQGLHGTVSEKTHGAQTPWETSALTGELYLAGAGGAECAGGNPPDACLWRDRCVSSNPPIACLWKDKQR